MSRNQVIPMGINQKDSIDIILERVEHFLIGSKDPNLSLEIEGKLGNFSLKKESNRDIFSILEKFSCQNFIILDESLYKFEKNFNSGIEERLFFNLLDYFKRLYSFAKIYLINNNENDPWKEYYSHLTREVKELISVDYVLGNCNKKKQRLTYDIGSGLSYIEKTTKVNFDLLHNSIIYLFF